MLNTLDRLDLFRNTFFRNAPWVTNDNDFSSMYNPQKFTGASMTSGKFFTGGRSSLAVGALDAFNNRGAVYICEARNLEIENNRKII